MMEHSKALTERFRRVVEARGLGAECDVVVERDGRWFVLRGRVDSHGTRSALISQVPEIDGARWVVDHLQVGRTR